MFERNKPSKELDALKETNLALAKGIARYTYDVGVPNQIRESTIYSTSLGLSDNRIVQLRFTDTTGVRCDFDKVLEEDPRGGNLVIDMFPVGERNGFLISQKLDGKLKEFIEIDSKDGRESLLSSSKSLQTTQAHTQLHETYRHLLGDISDSEEIVNDLVESNRSKMISIARFTFEHGTREISPNFKRYYVPLSLDGDHSCYLQIMDRGKAESFAELVKDSDVKIEISVTHDGLPLTAFNIFAVQKLNGDMSNLTECNDGKITDWLTQTDQPTQGLPGRMETHSHYKDLLDGVLEAVRHIQTSDHGY